MKKIAIAAGLIAACALGQAQMKVTVDGKPVAFPGTKPKTVTGRVMVPLRGVFEALGVYVEYNPVMHRIVARKSNEDIELRLNEKIAKKNGSEIEMDVAPISVRGRVMVPLRFLAEAVGAIVTFNKATNTIELYTTAETFRKRNAIPPPQ